MTRRRSWWATLVSAEYSLIEVFATCGITAVLVFVIARAT